MSEPFSQSVIDTAWNSAKGKCERCNKTLNKSSHELESPIGWKAHHKNNNDSAAVSNCEILCQNCYKKMLAYDRS